MSDVAGAQAPTEQPAATNVGGGTNTANGQTNGQASPWWQGKADTDMLGYLQNKGWDKVDAATAAYEATRAHREAQKLLGAPADQLIRLPRDAKDEAGWNSLYQRLGKPKDPTEYDFTNALNAEGTAIDDGFADAIRKAAWKNHLSKDAATDFARAMAAHEQQVNAAEGLEAETRKQEQIANIRKSWGPNFNANQITAMEGARRLGVSQELYDNMARAVGFDVVAELFRKVGAGTKEATYHEGNGATAPTVEAAQARLTELMQDKDWVKRVSRGDVTACREKSALVAQIAMSKGYEP